ncbi:hypothetical protein ACB094_11G062100 [Castanea mollissima]
MGNMKGTKKAKMILVPYPAQGHVTPMLKLASAFYNRGIFDTILITPEFIHHQIASSMEPKDQILCMPIPDGLDKDTPRDFFAIEMAMEKNMPVHLEAMVHKLVEDGEVVCVVVDLLASWAVEVANRCRVPVAGFWPVMFAAYQMIAAIPDMVRTGLVSDTGIPQHLGRICFLPNQPMLSTEDLPWLIGTLPARKARFKFWTRTLDRSRTLRWLLVNSLPDEYIDGKHTQSVKSSQDHPRVFPIGPLSNHVMSKNPSFWEEDKSCLDWLDKQKSSSVIYISFGSWVSPIGEGKVENLALALEASGRPFLWVLGSTWREGLPIGYLERVAIKFQGKVVSWAPQMEVLRHKAVGCYLTHCGWNSTMEAIQCQKRLLCYPVAGDQFINNKYIVEVWKIGLQLNGFGRKDVEEGLRRVMEDTEMQNRLKRLHERTMGDEAKSRVMSNLTAFIHDLN